MFLSWYRVRHSYTRTKTTTIVNQSDSTAMAKVKAGLLKLLKKKKQQPSAVGTGTPNERGARLRTWHSGYTVLSVP